MRPRRRWRWALLGLVFTLIPACWIAAQQARQRGWVYLVLPKWVVKQDVASGEFHVQILETRNPNAQGWTRLLRVQRNRNTLLELDGMYWSIGPVGDVTGDGVPDVAVTSDSGGTGCYKVHYLLSLDQRRPASGLAVLAVLECCGDFKDVDGDGITEFVALDRTFAYRWTSGADSPYPEVVLRIAAGRGVVAPDLMHKPPMTDAEINRRLAFFRNGVDGWDNKFASLLDVTLDLIYAGNEAQAWQVLREHWPQEQGRREHSAFEGELRSALAESPFWEGVRAANTPVAMPTGIAMP